MVGTSEVNIVILWESQTHGTVVISSFGGKSEMTRIGCLENSRNSAG